MATIIIIALLVILVLYVIRTQRAFVVLEEKMKNAFGQINVQLKSRWDALTNLVEMTKSRMSSLPAGPLMYLPSRWLIRRTPSWMS